jgi:hypothetical protein
MDINSPSDCFVIRVRPSGIVKAGEELFALYSPDLDKQIDRVLMRQEELSISARQFSDGRRQEWKKLQVALLEQLRLQLESQRSLHKNAQAKVELGSASQPELDYATLQLSVTESSFLQQQQTVLEFDRETKDSIDDITSKSKHAKDELERLNDLKKRLTITAPFAGDFTPRYASGLFCGINECLGVLNPWA